MRSPIESECASCRSRHDPSDASRNTSLNMWNSNDSAQLTSIRIQYTNPFNPTTMEEHNNLDTRSAKDALHAVALSVHSALHDELFIGEEGTTALRSKRPPIRTPCRSWYSKVLEAKPLSEKARERNERISRMVVTGSRGGYHAPRQVDGLSSGSPAAIEQSVSGEGTSACRSESYRCRC